MTGSIVFWCFASGLMPLARRVSGQYLFAYVFFVRALLGLAQSGIVTSTSAMAARSAISASDSAARFTLERFHVLPSQKSFAFIVLLGESVRLSSTQAPQGC